MDTEFNTKLDLAKLNNTKVIDLMSMEVLLLEETVHGEGKSAAHACHCAERVGACAQVRVAPQEV